MKKILATVLTVIVGGACLCGNAVPSKDTAYCDDGISLLSETNIVVNYVDRSENKFNMVLRHPYYTTSPYLADCACIAGANVIGFYDRYDENLIPNHSSGYTFNEHFLYSIQDTNVTEVVRQLYADMGTDDTGTTVTEFKNGMVTFCNRKGKTISFTSCMQNGKFDYAAAKRYMEANLPVVLFCSGYNVADMGTFDNYDRINYYESSANHVMVGFGWKEVNYALTATSNALYQYVAVASCTGNKSNGFYDINYNTNVNDAYAINIY